MTEEIIKCVKGESCIHCGSTYCRFVDEVNELEQENKDLKKQIESDKGLITVGGKQQYQYLQRIDELEQENKELKDELKSFKLPDVVTLLTNWRTGELDRIHNKIANERDTYRSALEEIKSIIINNNSMLVDKKDYIELQCGEPIAFKLQKIYNKINEVLDEKEL